MKHNVFVYGTLRRGEINHDFYLKHSKLLATTYTEPGFVMLCPRFVPYVIAIPGAPFQIKGEVYSVNNRTLRRLDDLEGHPFCYERKEIKTGCGLTAWIYLSADDGLVLSGDFKSVKNRKPKIKKEYKNVSV